jgi:hypothetical protein
MGEGAGIGFEFMVDHFVNIGKGMRSIRRKMKDPTELEIGGTISSNGAPVQLIQIQSRPSTGRKWHITFLSVFGNDPHTNIGALITPPAVPATGIAQSNYYPFPVAVTVSGGTVTAINVNGSATGLTSGTVWVPSGGSISIAYTVAPTWVWTEQNGSTTEVGIFPGTTQAFVDVYSGSEPDSINLIGGMPDCILSGANIPTAQITGHKSLWCHSGHTIYGLAYNVPASTSAAPVNVALIARVR